MWDLTVASGPNILVGTRSSLLLMWDLTFHPIRGPVFLLAHRPVSILFWGSTSSFRCLALILFVTLVKVSIFHTSLVIHRDHLVKWLVFVLEYFWPLLSFSYLSPWPIQPGIPKYIFNWIINCICSFLCCSYENNRLSGPELQGLVPYDFGCWTSLARRWSRNNMAWTVIGSSKIYYPCDNYIARVGKYRNQNK